MTDPIVTRHANIALARQPMPADLTAWAEAGVVHVVNNRTHPELDQLGFDMAASVAEAGMGYDHLPLGGPSGVNPEHTVRLGEVIAAAGDRPVVIHCLSGTRSAHLYAAHLIHTRPDAENPLEGLEWPGGLDMNLVNALLPKA